MKRRTNQFNLMLTDEELAILHENAEKKGYVNKSQYVRELLRGDAPVGGSETEKRIAWEQIITGNRKYMRRCMLWIIAANVVILIMTILIYSKLSG